ncbi:hypothetical protein cyc_09207 [Cyclospora cayetanensis]|uniref:DUF2384 domain-containing protein n=1 Tax=Cyclospora cayetanensis TaxID=88456 RepID=A0A1D3D4A6_9EIME|nr:hypothetical protein cyc_09207 [Cyclospora cayetanensis]
MLGIAIVLSFLFATYVFGYEHAQQQVRYDGCYGQERGQSFDPIVAAQQYVNGEGNPKARDHHNYVQAGEPLDKSMAVACQANAIMRASMRIQILVWPFSRSRAIRWQPDRWQEVRLRHFIEMLDLTLRMLGDEGALWLRTNNRALFGQSPINVLIDRLSASSAMIDIRVRDIKAR